MLQPGPLAWHELERWWRHRTSSGGPIQEVLFGFMADSEVVFPMPGEGADLEALRRELAAQIVGFEGVTCVAWAFEEAGALVVRTASQTEWAVVRRSLTAVPGEDDHFEEGEGTAPWGDWWTLSPNQGQLQSKLMFSTGRNWGPVTVGEA